MARASVMAGASIGCAKVAPVITLLVAFQGLACSPKAGAAFEPFPYPREAVKAQVRNVRFSDSRPRKQQGHFDTPIISMPGQREQRPVAVQSTTVTEMRRRVGKIISGGERSISLDVRILDGFAGWEASWIDETVFAKVKLAVEFRDDQTGTLLITAFGEASGSKTWIDAADEEPNELFQAAVLAAFDRAIADPSVVAALSSAVQ
ncbi:MAG: hypothetical protein QM784_37270 [Polyangiaceae bacterium]